MYAHKSGQTKYVNVCIFISDILARKIFGQPTDMDACVTDRLMLPLGNNIMGIVMLNYVCMSS